MKTTKTKPKDVKTKAAKKPADEIITNRRLDILAAQIVHIEARIDALENKGTWKTLIDRLKGNG